MRKIVFFALISALLLETACAYHPQSQTWQPNGHSPQPTKRPRAYR